MKDFDIEDFKRIFYKRLKLDFIELGYSSTDDDIIYYFIRKGKQKVLREIREIENNNE